MKYHHSKSHIVALLAACTAMMTACGPQEKATETSASPLAAYVTTAPAPAAISVKEARGDVAPGQVLQVTGRIAGKMEPFSPDYATLILADESLETCERRPGDTCPTPWDACCVDPAQIKSLRILVQLADGEGRPLEGSLQDVGGLTELSRVTVVGLADPSSTSANLILNATKIYYCP